LLFDKIISIKKINFNTKLVYFFKFNPPQT
jgi:hypothetical protein